MSHQRHQCALKGLMRLIPKEPGDINASQQGLLEIAEHFFRRKMQLREQEMQQEEENPGEGGIED